MRNIYASIDIGSDTVKVLVCEMYEKRLNVLAKAEALSEGIKRGLIFDADKAFISVKKAIKEVEDKLGFKLNKAIVTVPAYNADFEIVTGALSITSDHREISGDDVMQLLKTTADNNIGSTKELIEVNPIEFAVDNETNISNPVGMVGHRLAVRGVMVTTPKKNVYSVISVIEKLGIKVVDVSLSMIGDYEEFRTNVTDNSVGVIINVGGSTTSVSLFNKGILIKNSIMQLGGRNIDNDIAYIYKIDRSICKKIKDEFVVANKRLTINTDYFETKNLKGEIIKINHVEASEIAISRIDEILYLAKEEIKYLTNKKISYIIVTGGVSEIPGFDSEVKSLFGNRASSPEHKVIGIRDNRYAPSTGVVRNFYDKIELRGKNYSMFTLEDEERLIEPNFEFDNTNTQKDTVLDKVFGYFTEN